MGCLGTDIKEMVAVQQLSLAQTAGIQTVFLFLPGLREIQMEPQTCIDGIFC
jgi:hypothetical protein